MKIPNLDESETGMALMSWLLTIMLVLLVITFFMLIASALIGSFPADNCCCTGMLEGGQ